MILQVNLKVMSEETCNGKGFKQNILDLIIRFRILTLTFFLIMKNKAKQ